MPSSPNDLVHELARTAGEIQQAFNRRVGISRTRLSLVREISAVGEISQAEIRRRLQLDAATVTRLAKEVEADGWVTRRPDPGDSRLTLVALTALGGRELQSAQSAHEEFVGRLVAGVTQADAAVVSRVLGQLRENGRTA